jgi:hypothetical protein
MCWLYHNFFCVVGAIVLYGKNMCCKRYCYLLLTFKLKCGFQNQVKITMLFVGVKTVRIWVIKWCVGWLLVVWSYGLCKKRRIGIIFMFVWSCLFEFRFLA